MTYLDGSGCFFDIEGCFSNLINKVRDESYDGIECNPNELYKEILSFYGIKNKNVAVSKEYDSIFEKILDKKQNVMLFDHDEICEKVCHFIPDEKCIWYEKNDDMKIKISSLLKMIDDNSVSYVIFSNPCFPTSMYVEKNDIKSLLESTNAIIIVDESHLVDIDNSLTCMSMQYDNLIVLKRLPFGGNPIVTISGTDYDIQIDLDKHDIAASTVMFKHNSAIKTAARKISDSIESLYIRIKKIAIKYDAIKRLYRTKSDNIFLECGNSKHIAENMIKNGLKIGYDDKYIWFTSGTQTDNEVILTKLEKLLTD